MNKKTVAVKKHKQVKFVLVALVAVSLGLAVGCQLKVRWHQAMPTHELALPWVALEEGWRAVHDDEDILHGETLEKLTKMQGEKVVLFGYMLPLHVGEKHQHFLLSSRASSCPYCMPANAGNLVEIHMDEALPHRNEALLLQGVFAITQDVHSDMMYSLTEAFEVDG